MIPLFEEAIKTKYKNQPQMIRGNDLKENNLKEKDKRSYNDTTEY